MIRRIILTAAIITVSVTCGYAQYSIDNLFREFTNSKETNTVNIGKIGMKLASLFTDAFGVESVEVIEFPMNGYSVKQQFTDAVKNLKDTKYETMVNSNENGERVKVMVRIKDDIIHELVVLSTGNQPSMVRIKGKIKKSDIDRVVSEHK